MEPSARVLPLDPEFRFWLPASGSAARLLMQHPPSSGCIDAVGSRGQWQPFPEDALRPPRRCFPAQHFAEVAASGSAARLLTPLPLSGCIDAAGGLSPHTLILPSSGDTTP